jgi:hypothetical protein
MTELLTNPRETPVATAVDAEACKCHADAVRIEGDACRCHAEQVARAAKETPAMVWSDLVDPPRHASRPHGILLAVVILVCLGIASTALVPGVFLAALLLLPVAAPLLAMLVFALCSADPGPSVR